MRQDRLLEIVGRIYQRKDAVWDQGQLWPASEEAPQCLFCLAFRESGRRLLDIRRGSVYLAGKNWFGLTGEEADWAFDERRTLPELIHFATTGELP